MSGAANTPDSRINPQRPFLAVSVAVFRGERVLLAQRADHGRWSLPGGLVEAGESLDEAALRELVEETGVVAAEPVFSHFHEIIDRDAVGNLRHHYVIAVYAARWMAGDGIISPEAREIGWFASGDIGALNATDGLEDAIQRAQSVWTAHQSGKEVGLCTSIGERG